MKRRPITPEENEAAYQRCLERERDRERKHKETRQGAFEGSFVHFDFEAEEARERERTTSWLSDHGHGLELLYRALDPEPPKPTRKQLINRARMAITRHLPECLQTFWLVIKNGNNREESIWELMQQTRRKGRPQKHSTLHSSKNC